MKLKIKLCTATDCATQTLNNVKVLLGFQRKIKWEGYVNKTNDVLYLSVEGDERRVVRVRDNVIKYKDTITKIVSDNKTRRGLITIGATNEQLDELKAAYEKKLNITIIKETEAQTKVNETETLWERITKTFSKVKQ